MSVIAKNTTNVTELLPAGKLSLDELANKVNEESVTLEGHGRSMLECAFRIGDCLLEAQVRVEAEHGYGEWEDWKNEHIHLKKVQSITYMKLSKEFRDHVQRAELLQKTDSIRGALRLLSEDAEEEKTRKYWLLKDWKRLKEMRKEKIIDTALETSSVQFNRQEDTTEDQSGNIEWARWSWNPVTGCKHDCPYCYARDIANRFYEQKFEPSFWPDRLAAASNTTVPRKAENDIGYKNVFTCSMADLFGKWVPREWIQAVLDVVADNQQWNFLFLTKFPSRYLEFEFPENAWIGTSVDMQARAAAVEKVFSHISGGTKWVSVEPMLEPIQFSQIDLFDWIVCGGASRSSITPEWRPPIDWWQTLRIEALELGIPFYMKTNLQRRERSFPGQPPAEENSPESLYSLGRKK